MRSHRAKYASFWSIVATAAVCLHCGDAPSASSEGESEQAESAANQDPATYANDELAELKKQASADVSPTALLRGTGYSKFPGAVYAPKNGGNSADPNVKGATVNAHELMENLGHQAYTHALLAVKEDSGKFSSGHAKSAKSILTLMIDTDFNFRSDPAAPSVTNDNRTLEAAWLVTNLARSARILDKTAPADWKKQEKWDELKATFVDWLANKGSLRRDDTSFRSMASLVRDQGTMGWVSDQQSRGGSTNRTFALLEAQMRIAELGGGGDALKSVFVEFSTKWLDAYFTESVACVGEPTTKPADLKGQTCLKNKDEDRKDNFHPLMGLSSIVHIVDIGKRHGLEVSAAQHAKIVSALRWGADNNKVRPKSNSKDTTPKSTDVNLWEVAFRIYSEKELGPLVKRERDLCRARAVNKRAKLAWGYELLARGF